MKNIHPIANAQSFKHVILAAENLTKLNEVKKGLAQKFENYQRHGFLGMKLLINEMEVDTLLEATTIYINSYRAVYASLLTLTIHYCCYRFFRFYDLNMTLQKGQKGHSILMTSEF